MNKKPKITGKISVHMRGFGFFYDEKNGREIFIAKSDTLGAINGDEVEIKVVSRSDKGFEGKVVSIITRAKSEIVGVVEKSIESGQTWAFSQILGKDHSIELFTKTPLKIGERVLMKVAKWGRGKKATKCEFIKKIAPMKDALADTHVACLEFEIPEHFDHAILDEAKSFAVDVDQKTVEERTDLTDQVCVTIDPDTARDFDDALSVVRHKDGSFDLGVHIADVSYYVTPNSLLDQEAYRRGNSTYLPGKCIPMLPEELSNHLCSLKEGVVRLASSCLAKFDKEGNLLSYELLKTAIKSRKRFTYEEAFAIIEGKEKSEHKKLLDDMVTLALLLKKKRHERGCVDLGLDEVKLDIDKKGVPTGYRIIPYDISHQLVEEFMLKANEIVATHLLEKNESGIFRIHDKPAAETSSDFFAYARHLGFFVPAKPEAKDIQKLFEDAANSPHKTQLSIAFIRSMKLAEYSHENMGHYGLALENYCHFTSPIRRYTDLIIHRALFEKIDTDVDVERIAKHCSERERHSFKAEQSVLSIKKMRYLKNLLRDNENLVLDARVTKCLPHGVIFDTVPLGVDGMIHVSELDSDYFEYNQKKSALIGRGTGVTYALGTNIKVRPLSINLNRMQYRWEIVT